MIFNRPIIVRGLLPTLIILGSGCALFPTTEEATAVGGRPTLSRPKPLFGATVPRPRAKPLLAQDDGAGNGSVPAPNGAGLVPSPNGAGSGRPLEGNGLGVPSEAAGALPQPGAGAAAAVVIKTPTGAGTAETRPGSAEQRVAAVSPRRLIGIDWSGARRLLGAPNDVSERPPAIVWAYESGACRLELTFYLDITTQSFRVLTYDVSPKGAAGLTGDRCLGSFRTAVP